MRNLRSSRSMVDAFHHCSLVALCYVGLMSHRAVAVGLTQIVLVGLGLGGLPGYASEMAPNPPVALVTNVVAQRAVHDVIQTLLAVTPAGSPAWLGAQTGSLASLQSNTPQSNTVWTSAVAQARAAGVTLITNAFAGFVPGSLAGAIWAGFRTNDRGTNMWEYAHLPPDWPTNPPVLRWNTNSLLWGRKGMTAISQVCEGMGAFGQGTPTALTRRHAYVRGHGMGPSGLDPTRVGRRVWFCTRNNQLVVRKIKLLVIHAPEKGSPGDYSIILFDADLPPTIEPMRVVDQTKVQRKYLGYPYGDPSHKPLFMALQGGFVSAGVPGWIVQIRGGDSGNPIMLPLPDELVFCSGVTTSRPSPAMQADMDMLSRKAGLDPGKYQMQWVNLDAYPDISPKP